ncbi:LPXTG cell wall anchor domain-containing protein [Bacillus massiliglaciei]|uniref:LPXTG cell wall anchor domain-containing protein n=1 Tax=Bacillus massiliglaciei TaxID=1816693 RepID=UPI000DA60FC5|nr:LPXTG cell wall anchor domain-containing protein [Bacillus massiliglaciei]
MKKWFVSVFTIAFLLAGQNSSVFAATDQDCGEFSSHEDVMAFWYDNGYSAENDPHDLDRDDDGLPCEVDSDEYDNYVASREDASSESTDDSSPTTDTDSEEASEGEELPDTATDSIAMMAIGAALLTAGGYLILRRHEKTKA